MNRLRVFLCYCQPCCEHGPELDACVRCFFPALFGAPLVLFQRVLFSGGRPMDYLFVVAAGKRTFSRVLTLSVDCIGAATVAAIMFSLPLRA